MDETPDGAIGLLVKMGLGVELKSNRDTPVVHFESDTLFQFQSLILVGYHRHGECRWSRKLPLRY
jgi:hypothetical protein